MSTPISQNDFNNLRAKYEGQKDYNHILRSLLHIVHLLSAPEANPQTEKNLLASIHELTRSHARGMPQQNWFQGDLFYFADDPDKLVWTYLGFVPVTGHSATATSGATEENFTHKQMLLAVKLPNEHFH
jgi:hypothetical protein